VLDSDCRKDLSRNVHLLVMFMHTFIFIVPIDMYSLFCVLGLFAEVMSHLKSGEGFGSVYWNEN